MSTTEAGHPAPLPVAKPAAPARPPERPRDEGPGETTISMITAFIRAREREG